MTSTEIAGAVLPWMQAFATAFVPVAGTLAGLWLRKRGINADVVAAAGRGATLGYSAIVKSGMPHNSAEAIALGEQVATDYLATMMPSKLLSAGLDPAKAAALAAAQLGKVLQVAVPMTGEITTLAGPYATGLALAPAPAA